MTPKPALLSPITGGQDISGHEFHRAGKKVTKNLHLLFNIEDGLVFRGGDMSVLEPLSPTANQIVHDLNLFGHQRVLCHTSGGTRHGAWILPAKLLLIQTGFLHLKGMGAYQLRHWLLQVGVDSMPHGELEADVRSLFGYKCVQMKTHIGSAMLAGPLPDGSHTVRNI